MEIACGEVHSLARLRDGMVVAWGAGGSGSDGYFCSLALNDGSPVLTLVPVPCPPLIVKQPVSLAIQPYATSAQGFYRVR